jgi:FkbM family methyltransferase
MRVLIRIFRNVLRKARRGAGLRDKTVLGLIVLGVEAPRTAYLTNLVLKLLAADGLIQVRGEHPCTGKQYLLFVRAGNSADYFILWEFVSGEFYRPPVSAECVVDCGANIGLFAVHAGLAFPSAKLLCYEPDQANFEMLHKNLAINGVTAECRSRGVWSRKMDGFFHPKQAFDGYVSEEPSRYPIACEVPEILPQTWLKMDVEGAEYEVLPALLRGAHLPDHISMELHDYFRRGKLLTDQLVAHGYELSVVTDGSLEPGCAEIQASRALR